MTEGAFFGARLFSWGRSAEMNAAADGAPEHQIRRQEDQTGMALAPGHDGTVRGVVELKPVVAPFRLGWENVLRAVALDGHLIRSCCRKGTLEPLH